MQTDWSPRRITLGLLWTTLLLVQVQPTSAEGAADGVVNINLRIHAVAASDDAPLEGATVALTMVPYENIMTPPGVDKPTIVSGTTDEEVIVTPVGTFGWGNTFNAKNDADGQIYRSLWVLNGFLHVEKEGCTAVSESILAFERDPIYSFDGGHTSPYPRQVTEVKVFARLTPASQ